MEMKHLIALGILLLTLTPIDAQDLSPLSVGLANHAFDHLGPIADQAPAAAASGATILYSTGFGSLAYSGLPAPAQLEATAKTTRDYLKNAKSHGIRLALGYVCATSIVKIETFDQNWSHDFRAQFSSSPKDWLQQDCDGNPLPSWYAGDYCPACMNNPDWRTYEKSIVRLQLDSGHDGIFFDNPTVHPNGCYCPHCMRKFAAFLSGDGTTNGPSDTTSLRKLAISRPNDFLRFRSTIAADFLSEMRAYARTINPAALVTCNNSLNSPDAFFSQCRTYAYNIREMSKAEDLVVVEDMATQPRTKPDGGTVEYGPVYDLLHSIAHDKPVVAVTLADGDYHTPPNQMRLAMAEAAAHGASYLSWPTWPENVRQKMAAAVRPQSDFLRQHADLLNHTTPRADAAIFLPFRRWLDTTRCEALRTALTLSRSNIPFRVLTEDDLQQFLRNDAPPALLIESESILTDPERAALSAYKSAGGRVIATDHTDWPATLRAALRKPSLILTAPPTIRGVLREQGGKTIIHLLNLNVRRVSSFEDRVTPGTDLKLRVRRRAAGKPAAVIALTADAEATHGPLQFTVVPDEGTTVLELTLRRIDVSTLLVIE
jgi:hypothetical protein